MNALYNEVDPYAAQWLRNLVEHGHVAPGRVEQRSIADLRPRDVTGPGQRHFFAGIGGWSYALRLAGIADDANIWTGSCPCQPFSDAGKGLGVRDPRHLWPAWFELIRECRPPTIFGEQVASRDGLAWLDLVRSDLEGCGYAFGASDLCAAGVGAPHIRQRLYFVAHAGGERREGVGLRVQPGRSRSRRPEPGGAARLVVDASGSRSGRHTGAVSDAEAQGEGERREPRRVADESVDAGAVVAVGDADRIQQSRRAERPRLAGAQASRSSGLDGYHRTEHAGPARRMADGDSSRWNEGGLLNQRRTSGPGSGRTESDGGGFNDPWSDCDWLPCTDGVSRPVEPGTFPLAHGLSGRVAVRRTDGSAEEEHWYNRTGALAGFGNAIVPQVAAAFIEAAIAARGDLK